MKKSAAICTLGSAILVTSLITGCVASIGNRNPNVTIGQQLMDLQKAKESGAITPSEYETQKGKLLGSK